MRLAATCAYLFLMPLAFLQGFNASTSHNKKAPCRNLLNFSYRPEGMKSPKKRILIFQNHFDQLNEAEKICLLRKVLEFFALVNEDVWTRKVPEEHICELHEHLLYFKHNCLKCEKCEQLYGFTTQPKKGCSGIFKTEAKPVSKKKCYKEAAEKKKLHKKSICKVTESRTQSNQTSCTGTSKRKRKSNVKVCTGIFGDKKQSECSNYNRTMVINGTGILHCQLRKLRNEAKTNRPRSVQEKILYELDILQGYLRSTNYNCL